jgi:hypothetical protein
LHSALGVLIVAGATFALAGVLAARRRPAAVEPGAVEADVVEEAAVAPATAVAPAAPAGRRRLFGRRGPLAPADEPATAPAGDSDAAEPEPVGAPERE